MSTENKKDKKVTFEKTPDAVLLEMHERLKIIEREIEKIIDIHDIHIKNINSKLQRFEQRLRQAQLIE